MVAIPASYLRGDAPPEIDRRDRDQYLQMWHQLDHRTPAQNEAISESFAF
jgi:hypothetical protein